MADTVVSFLLENVAQLVSQEVSTLLGVGDEIKSLHVELILINQFLRNSEGKREKVKDLISLIQNLAHRAEDVIDTFVINMAKNKRRSKLGKIFNSFGHGGMIQSVSADAKSIVSQINTIYSRMDVYGIEKYEATSRDGDHDLTRRTTLNERRCQVEEDEVVSFVKDADEVMKMLSKPDRRLDVISIVGMGGLGKTTLAKKIYNDNFVKNRFDCRAWVNVSQDFETKDLLLNILRSVAESMEGMYEMDKDQLAKEMKKCLGGKRRYLIVLDDVWTTEVWKGIKGAFPDNMNGCRILVTSRVTKVALDASKTLPYLLPRLSKDDGWELLSKKAFRGDDCLKELEEDGKKIVDKCNCLPLALVVVGGLLATREKTTRVWSGIADNVSWYLKKNLENCLDILALSYEELPPHLKLCFLYFGVFPEDFEITARQLIRLWIAEGFIITQDDSRKLEDVAEEYLEDLVDRNLIMVARRRCDGGVKSCFIHDLLRDLCISEGIKEHFFVVHTDKVFSSSSSSPGTTTKPRRLSIHCSSTSRYISSLPCDSSLVRTLVCFGDPDKLSIENFRSLYKGFRLLRVLDLGSTVVISIPTQVEKLIHLRYLRMNAPQISEIPSSISNLPNLQTLDLRESRIKYFTRNFWKMQQLRHLFLSGDCSLSHMHRQNDIKTMCNLQTLSTVSSDAAYMLDGYNIFPNLRKLGLQCSQPPTYLNVMPKFGFKSVQSLKIIEGSHFLSHQGALSSCMSSLTKLTLIQTKIRLPVLEMVAKLPNLEILKLLKKSVGEVSIECGEGWFPKLQVLHMVELDLKEWTFKQVIPPNIYEIKRKIENLKFSQSVQERLGYGRSDSSKDEIDREREIKQLEQDLYHMNMSICGVEAMKSLRNLSISKCRDLKIIPKDLKKVNTLRHVKASWCASILEGKLRELGGNVRYEFQNYK